MGCRKCALRVIVVCFAFGSIASAGIAQAALGPGARPDSTLISSTGAATDPSGLWATPIVAVDTSRGALVVHEIDGSVSSNSAGGTVWPFDRWYDSGLSAVQRDVGKGWTTGPGYDVRLEISASVITYVAPSQARYDFTVAGDGSYPRTNDLPDDDATLTKRDDGGYDVSLSNSERTLHFDGQGLLTSATDADGVAIRFDYTSANGQTRLSAAYNPASQATRFSYEGTGLVREADDPASHHGAYTYANGLLSTVTSLSGTQTTYGYDTSGRLNAISNPTRAVSVGYDSTGRVTSLLDGATELTFSYPATVSSQCGDAVTETDVGWSDGTSLTQCFDAAGMLVASFIPDTQAPTLDDPGFVGLYDSGSDKTLVQWDSANDPDRADGSPGSGVSSYTVRVRRDDGAWSDWQATSDPQLLLDGGHAGQAIDIELQFTDQAGNLGTGALGTVHSTAFDSSDGDIACQPTDFGYSPSCVDDSANSADDDEETDSDVDLVDPDSGASSSRAGARAALPSCAFLGTCVLQVSHNGWAIVRNRPQEYTIGNAHDGWQTTVHSSVTAASPTKGQPGVYADGFIDGPGFHECGWIKTSALESDGLGSAFDFGLCAPGFGDFSSGPDIRNFAAGVNCQNTATSHTCVDGYPVKIKTSTTRYRNIAPYPPRLSFNRQPRNAAGPISAGKTVYWRYTTKDGNWVMVRYGTRTHGRTNWFFVRRDHLDPICVHRQCQPHSEDG